MKKILFAAPHYFSSFARVGGHQYARMFAKNSWDVLYVSNFLSPLNLLLNLNDKSVRSRFLNHVKGGEKVSKNLLSYVPFTAFPHHNHTTLDRKWILNNYYRFSIPSLKSYLKKGGFDKVDLLWLDCPNQLFWKKIFKNVKSIYRISDAIEEFPNTGQNLLCAHYEAIEKCDLVIVTSKIILSELEKNHLNKTFHYCPNGVDLSNFIRKDYSYPSEYVSLKSKIALYVGAIDEWFDLDLLLYLADHCKNIDFIVIGPDKFLKMQTIVRPNIKYLGPKPYLEVPNYMFYCDFGIIPFKKSKLVRCVNPIKMYEFFSLGKPVISTTWEELELINSPCLLAKDHHSFLGLILDQWNLSQTKKDHLIQYAKDNTWDNRFKYITNLVKLG